MVRESRNLTLKQRSWLKAYAETGNATLSARLAGYRCSNEQSYRQIGYENLTKLDISELMEELGLSNVALLRVLTAGLTRPVKQTIVKITTLTDGNVETREIDYAEVPDFDSRFKFLELALKLKNLV